MVWRLPKLGKHVNYLFFEAREARRTFPPDHHLSKFGFGEGGLGGRGLSLGGLMDWKKNIILRGLEAPEAWKTRKLRVF